MALNNSASDRKQPHKAIARVSSIGVASVLAILIATSVMPPLVSDQSDRAVVNAPTTLLTAPIPGDIASIQARPGLPVDRGAILADITNSRIDRSTAIQLDASVAEMREQALAAARKHESNQAYLAVLDKTIQEKSAQLEQILKAQISELKAKLAEANAVVESRRLAYDQVSQLAEKNITNANTRKPARQQYEAALSGKDAADAKLQQKVSQLDGLSRNVYVGEDLLPLAELAQKHRDIEFDAQRLAIEEKELQARIQDQTHLLEAENRRLESLTRVAVVAPMAGEIYSLSATQGRRVNAGDTLATFVDCERRFVVAIFSYRKAPDLAVGTRVEISGLDSAGSRGGVVTEILPKSSDKFDDLFAVPFPQTERRELYVLVRPDPDPPGRPVESSATSSCGIGRWVTVTRRNGWIPSASVVWRGISRGGQSLAALFGVGPAAATNLKTYAHREPRS